METTYSIAPGAVAEPGTPGGPGIALAGPQWLAIQTYVTDGLALPISNVQFAGSLGPGAPSDLSDFDQLITAYQSIYTHCSTWQNTVFPATVALASDIYDYGTHKAPVYYPPILTQAQILVNDPGNVQAQQTLTGILEVLENAADGYAAKASAVFAQIQQFAQDTSADQTTIVGPDGKTGLLGYYNGKYGSTSAAVAELNQQITAATDDLAAADAKYRHDVIVAATSATYAWVWPAGTVAAAIVAGIYGSDATADLARAKADQESIDTFGDQLAVDGNLITVLNVATKGLTKINTDLTAALPVIQAIEGAWGGMRDDIKAISALIATDIAAVPPIIMGLGVEEALKSWNDVAVAANNYRQTAYVKESGGPETSMHQWKLERHILPRAAAVPTSPVAA